MMPAIGRMFLRRLEANGGEAIRDMGAYWAGGFSIGLEDTARKLEARGYVRIETVGLSTFAVLLKGEPE